MSTWQPFALTALIVLCIAIVSLCAIPACIRRGCEPTGSLVRKRRREWLEERLNPYTETKERENARELARRRSGMVSPSMLRNARNSRRKR